MTNTRLRRARKSCLAAVVTVLAMGPGVVSAVAATPPANDVWSGAVTLSLGDVVQLDTSAATTGPADARANRACGAPFTNASVWYRFTPDRRLAFRLDMSDSDYEGGFMVFRGAPSAASMVTCGPDRLTVFAAAGVTYAIVAFSDTRRNGGQLVLSIAERPRPTIELDVDDEAILTDSGNALVSGAFRCRDASGISLRGELVQRLGREKIVGSAVVRVRRQCDGAWQPFTMELVSPTHRFGGGWAKLDIRAVSCNDVGCTRGAIDDLQTKMRHG